MQVFFVSQHIFTSQKGLCMFHIPVYRDAWTFCDFRHDQTKVLMNTLAFIKCITHACMHINKKIIKQAIFFHYLSAALKAVYSFEWIEKEKYLNKIMSQVLRAKKENSKLQPMSKILTCVCIHSWEKIETLKMGALTTLVSAKRRSRCGERQGSKLRNWSDAWIIIDMQAELTQGEKDTPCGTSLLCIQERRSKL